MASDHSKPDSSAQPYTRSETAFNADLREVLRAQGFGVIHVRDADTPGTYDLLITQVKEGWPPHNLWAELKVMDKELEPSQRTFYRTRLAMGDLLTVIRLREDHTVLVRDGQDIKEHLWVADYRIHDWKKTFSKLLTDYYSDL